MQNKQQVRHLAWIETGMDSLLVDQTTEVDDGDDNDR